MYGHDYRRINVYGEFILTIFTSSKKISSDLVALNVDGKSIQ